MGDARYITLEEATTILPVAAITLRRAIKAGDLPAYRIGRRLLIKPSEFDTWIESRKVTPTSGSRVMPRSTGPNSKGGLLERAIEKRSQL